MDEEGRIFMFFVVVVVAISVIFGTYALYKIASTEGKVDYCYVDHLSTGGYEVVGHRPWRPNAHLGTAGSPDEANKILVTSATCH